ncbi:MAG: Ppx/GppA family phosphatase [Actinomycetota bacterium]|nr:Ppx/GppA family phosphatase [Actinomycetota bacterium]
MSNEGQRIAVVDFGTNSTRLLVADVANGAVEELERRTDVTRLGEGVDRSGRLAKAAMERVFDTVAGYREVIDRLGGVTRAMGVATSAVRDSENGDELRAALCDRYGIDVEVIAGEEEARLTFLGATAGRSPAEAALVIDIGGGSTEYVVGTPASAPSFRVSTELGSVRQTERHLESDPPSDEQVSALESEANEILDAAVPPRVREQVTAGIAVAGTATSLAAIDLGLEPYDSDRVHGHRLEADACRRLLGRLAAVPVAQRRETRGLHPDRAPTIVAGAAILLQSIGAFGLGSIEVSEADILHGAALDAAGGGGRGEGG